MSNQESQQETAISIQNVSKVFRLPHEKHKSIKSVVLNLFRKKSYEEQQALDNVSFDIKKGDFYGIVGRNGSGKSTILKCIAGVYVPDQGSIEINGTLVPFIELGVGFNPELSGRDNVYLNGALLGFSREEMSEMYDDIVEFAELERFMDQKLKNYSSGMQVRLAFSIAIRAKGDILLLDEVLAVGDTAFQRKCFNYFMTLKKQNTTVVFVTHNMAAAEKFCNKMIVIDRGRIALEGTPQEATKLYDQMNAKQNNTTTDNNEPSSRWGSGEVRVKELTLRQGDNSSHGDDINMELEQGKSLTIELAFESASEEPKDIVAGLAFYDAFGVNISGPNSEKLSLKSDERLAYTINKLPLNPGDYSVVVAVFDKDLIDEYDHIDGAAKITVISEDHQLHGKVNLFGEWNKQ